MAVQDLDPTISNNIAASGSTIQSRDTIPFTATATDPGSGFIYAPSVKRDYYIPELKKALDTEVSELIPADEELVLDLVPRPIYEDALEALAIAEQTIDIQAQTIAELESQISELQSQIETLSSDLDNEKLLRVVAEANADNLRQQLVLINDSAQSALQRSILEGVQRAAAEAEAAGLLAEVEALKTRVIGLQSEIDTLNKLLQGKDAQIAAGASVTNTFTARPIDVNDPTAPPIYMDSIAYNYGSDPQNTGEGGRWVNGKRIELYNPTTVAVTVNITYSLGTSPPWFNVIPTSVTLQPGALPTVIELFGDNNKVVSLAPNNRIDKARKYVGNLTLTDAAVSTNVIKLATTLYKHTSR
jgi:hypothetical protein